MKISKVQGLKKIRLEQNYTIDDIANSIGVSKQMVSSYETGRYAPTDEYILKIAEFLKVNPYQLFGAGLFAFDNLEPQTEEDFKVIKEELIKLANKKGVNLE